MGQGIVTLGILAGGLGLFLLAVTMITEGLKLAAGNALRDMLGKWTRSPGHGIVTGMSMTAVVQSSSAVTVAIIGFVNAGLLAMPQALGVVFGANIGTTMTGWLVAVIGFKIKVETFALPLIGVGMILRLAGGDSRRAQFGTALAGFGLFFMGIDVLRQAFEGLAVGIDLQRLTVEGVPGVLMFVGIGFLMTVLTQSSSAAIAITLTAATGGILSLHAAASMVIGANIGTTSTAALAVIGATPNAKRVAAAHIIFNIGTGVVALLILPILFWVVKVTGKFLGLEDIPAVTLAMFHTMFNVLGVLLMWPATRRLAKFLERRFVTLEEIEGRAKYLDKTVTVSPMLALNALTLEISRIATISRRMALAALSAESGPDRQMAKDRMIMDKLSLAVADFITRLERERLTDEVSAQLAKMLRAEQHLLACADQALVVAKAQAKPVIVDDEGLQNSLNHYRAEVVRLIGLTNPEIKDFSLAGCEALLEQVQSSYDDVKSALLIAGAELRSPVSGLIELVERNSHIRRMARQMVKAMRYLNALYVINDIQFPETPKAGVGKEAPGV
ncbi:Na/Pi cotransporter family protein [Varunaivibrio sulfuroxidans]|uniref:Phosphate:Na+ symporter n=1 Tax=Varunaivibrio sulfuroxidans TaxID=1773489 RepID=A0A4R3JFR1_9PROT|nr:Na/Pi symporter [Varunaivibrio sulfuroxidans]TCS64702.1 phosphate:Na+ symporter [Varunaivibrio sulfuroxidans]WES29991.1 Na/Pi symporter [Varunaivibrio sulfuroxidans]